MHQGRYEPATSLSSDTPFSLFDEQAGITYHDLLHHTGFGIKIRFLLALTLIAILPSILLVVVLGSPSSNSSNLFVGRNAWLLLLGIFVLVVLVATWIALPIVRPIRRASRVIESTTEDVRKLAHDAQVIADDQVMGTTILAGASKRLSGRRQSIIRDATLITRTCQSTLPRLQRLHQKFQGTRDAQALEDLHVLYQGLQQMYVTAGAIADGLLKDTSLSQLDQAMEGAREVAKQFEAAGKQLEEETEHLETAARSLI